MKIISGVYKITNTITGDFYIGSSKDVKRRLTNHKSQSRWNDNPNNPLYLDFQKYGIDKFEFQVIAEVEPEKLKETEQEFIEKLQPIYNDRNANGWNIERLKESCKKYRNTDKYKEYQKTDKRKESLRKSNNKYHNQLCLYNGETLTFNALSKRFKRQGIEHPTAEAKKYIRNNNPIESYDVYP